MGPSSPAPSASPRSRAWTRPATVTRQPSMHPDARRGSATLLLALLACGGADRPPASRAAADSTAAAGSTEPALMAYVTNEGSGEVTIIDATLDSAVGTISV